MFGGTRIVAGSYFIGLKRAGTTKGTENTLGLRLKCHDVRNKNNRKRIINHINSPKAFGEF